MTKAALADRIALTSRQPQPYGSNWTCGALGGDAKNTPATIARPRVSP